MIDVRLLRTDLDAVRGGDRRAAAIRSCSTSSTRAAELDARLREITAERDAIRARVNELSKQVGRLRRDGDAAGAEALQAESRALGDRERQLADEHDAVADDAARAAAGDPQPAPPRRPRRRVGRRQPGRARTRRPARRVPRPPRVPHWETGAALGILDNERAIKISGAMFTMTRGLGATLGRALCQLALDRNADAFEEIRPPSLVTTATLTATGQLPKFADDAFAIERDDLWCIPTAEVPLTSIYRDEMLDEAELPVRLMAYTPCYRREAGLGRPRHPRHAARRTSSTRSRSSPSPRPSRRPRCSTRWSGGPRARSPPSSLPYRTIEICTGDLGQSHHRSFDIEVYAPGADTWLEVSSVSWFCDYQARRANIRFRRTTAQKGTRDRPHAERLGARRAPGVGGDPRELPPGRRLGRRSPRRCARTCAAPTVIEAAVTDVAPTCARGGSSTRRRVSTSPTSPPTRSSSGSAGTPTRRRPVSPSRTR